jgi:hypothetical protein
MMTGHHSTLIILGFAWIAFDLFQRIILFSLLALFNLQSKSTNISRRCSSTSIFFRYTISQLIEFFCDASIFSKTKNENYFLLYTSLLFVVHILLCASLLLFCVFVCLLFLSKKKKINISRQLFGFNATKSEPEKFIFVRFYC